MSPLSGDIRAAIQAMALEQDENHEGGFLLTQGREGGQFQVVAREPHREWPLLVGIVEPICGSGNPTDYSRNDF
ncbi:MAG: hypothetical protein ABI602_02460 [Candidatus Saccharibacteria bacterium]